MTGRRWRSTLGEGPPDLVTFQRGSNSAGRGLPGGLTPELGPLMANSKRAYSKPRPMPYSILIAQRVQAGPSCFVCSAGSASGGDNHASGVAR